MGYDKYAVIQSLSYSMEYYGDLRMNVEIRTNDQKIFDLLRPGHMEFSGIKTIDNEFQCLWCGTPNPIKHVLCSRCGAPRGFIIK